MGLAPSAMKSKDGLLVEVPLGPGEDSTVEGFTFRRRKRPGPPYGGKGGPGRRLSDYPDRALRSGVVIQSLVTAVTIWP